MIGLYRSDDRSGISAGTKPRINRINVTRRRMRGQYMNQPLHQPAKVVTSRYGGWCIFRFRLVVNENDVQVRVIPKLPAPEFAVSNNAKLGIRWRLLARLQCPFGQRKRLAQQRLGKRAEGCCHAIDINQASDIRGGDS